MIGIIIVNTATDSILRLDTKPGYQNVTPQNQVSKELNYGKATKVQSILNCFSLSPVLGQAARFTEADSTQP